MMVDPMFYAIFFDVEKPQTAEFALNKRIEEKVYNNLIDEAIPQKEVQLIVDDAPVWYTVESRKTFQIWNTVDNHYFIILEIKRKV